VYRHLFRLGSLVRGGDAVIPKRVQNLLDAMYRRMADNGWIVVVDERTRNVYVSRVFAGAQN
jgi:hypothetical protein